MARSVVWTAIFALVAGILQSTLLGRLAVYGTVPDLALGILIYSAYLNGTMTGQLAGFCSGILLDFLSASPLGLNALLRTLLGAACGLVRGAFFLDALFLPMALAAGATFGKALILLALHFLFSGAVPAYRLFEPVLWTELLLNITTAPLLFFFLRHFNPLLSVRREN
ncbi:MAG: rod shape-determining protein MreD [Spirochaetaceae bacterium]|jgi:rod shape-determining protein MreD|nr:rod shape-determining protein MreD [Spirochaetaceae bacterium]